MCSLEFPDIETKIWQHYQDDDVVVLGLSGQGLFGQEGVDTVSAFAEQTNVTFPLLLGDMTRGEYASSYGAISPYPFDVILDRDGTIQYLRTEFDAEAMRQTIEQLL